MMAYITLSRIELIYIFSGIFIWRMRYNDDTALIYIAYYRVNVIQTGDTGRLKRSNMIFEKEMGLIVIPCVDIVYIYII